MKFPFSAGKESMFEKLQVKRFPRYQMVLNIVLVLSRHLLRCGQKSALSNWSTFDVISNLEMSSRVCLVFHRHTHTRAHSRNDPSLWWKCCTGPNFMIKLSMRLYNCVIINERAKEKKIAPYRTIHTTRWMRKAVKTVEMSIKKERKKCARARALTHTSHTWIAT